MMFANAIFSLVSLTLFGLIFVNGQLHQSISPIQNNSLCQHGDYLGIDHFKIDFVSLNLTECKKLPGINYDRSVPATCLQHENKTLVKRIALVFMKAYNWKGFENVSELQVQSSLNEIVPELSLISVQYSCYSNYFYFDICTTTNVQGLKRGFLKLDTTFVQYIPTECTCSVKASSELILIKAIDVRLTSETTLQTYHDNILNSSNIFYEYGNSTLFWPLDKGIIRTGPTVNIRLSMEIKREFPESVWLLIIGTNMSISCSHTFGDDTTMTSALSPQNSSMDFSLPNCLKSTIPFAVSIVVLLSMVIVISYKYYELKKKPRSKDHNYDNLKFAFSDLTTYQKADVNAPSAGNEGRKTTDSHALNNQRTDIHGMDSGSSGIGEDYLKVVRPNYALAASPYDEIEHM